VVRDLVQRADRARRGRDRLLLFGRLAPAAGLLARAASVAGRWRAWPAATSVGLILTVLAALAVIVFLAGRRRESDDVVATRVDRDASLDGELRSAHWFASADHHDAWTDFHLARAAERAGRVAWDGLYLRQRQGKAWSVAAVSIVAALALPVAWPARVTVSAEGASGVAAQNPNADVDALRAKLDALLQAMGKDEMPADAAIADLETLKKLMAAVDPAMQKKLDELLKKKPLGKDAETKVKGLDDDLEERGDMADSAAGLPEDVRWALEDLAARLANQNANRQTNEKNPAASTETGEKGPGSAQAESSEAQAGESSLQMMRQAAADPGAAKMMPGAGGMMGGDSRAGAGGNDGKDPGLAAYQQIAQALRKEMIEANADTTGENVTKDDIRRKTEQGQSAMGLTRVAAPTSYDPSRAAAPPIIPEARQPLLQRYFIRR
jgi:hypothetical protein